MTLWTRMKAFLLVNRDWKQVVVKNTFWTSLAEGIVRLLKLALIFLVVRSFGPAEYGKFAFAFSFAAMFGIIFDSGLVVTLTREFSADRKNERLLPDVLVMRLALGLVGMSAIVAGSFWATQDGEARLMMIILGASMFVGEMLNLGYALIRARQKLEYECLVRVVQSVMLLAMVASALWASASVIVLSWAYFGANTLTLLGVVLSIRGRLKGLQFEIHWEVWKRLFRIGFPLALAGGMGALYNNIDSVMLGAWGQMTETGWYNAAAKIHGIVLVPMGLLVLVMFPAFTATANKVDESFRRRWDRWTSVMIGIGAFFACVVLAEAGQIVQLAFGADYQPAGPALQILILTAVLVYIYMPAYQSLIMFNQQTRLSWCLALGALINVLLNIVLIPRFSLYGAAWATVLTHAIILVQLFRDAARYTPVNPMTQSMLVGVIVAAISGLIAYLTIKMAGSSVWTSIPVGSGSFLISFVLLVRAKDLLARFNPVRACP